MRRVEIRVAVNPAVPGVDSEPLEQAVTVHLPEKPAGRLPVVVAFAGATYARSYFDLSLTGVMDASYSQAEHHTGAGLVLVACDHLGTGESSAPADRYALTPEALAAANALTVEEVCRRLVTGALAPEVPPIEPGALIGVGQSMGGCLLTIQQARHRTFQAIGVLGWSARHTSFPEPAGGRVAVEVPNRQADLRRSRSGFRFSPEQLAYCFHHEAEPSSVRRADRPGAPWRSQGVPPCALPMLSPGFVAEEAAAITVPVFVASGERDVVPDPHAEPLAYSSSPDVTVVVVAQMAHMHNFAPSRRLLWDRLSGWISSLGLRG